MNSDSVAPFVAGLAIGIAFVALFGLILSPSFPIQKAAAVDLSIVSQERYVVGDELNMMVRVRGSAGSCAYPHATITNANTGETVWDSGTTLIICDPDQTRSPVNIDWELGKSFRQNGNLRIDSNPVVIKQAGTYIISAQFDSYETSRSIEVVPKFVTITIPKDSSIAEAGITFQPQQMRVILGYNNTVVWVNEDNVASLLSADNPEAYPSFGEALCPDSNGLPGDYCDGMLIPPGGSFTYTFEKPGEIGYHGKPWMQGTVVVVSAVPAESMKSDFSKLPPDAAMPCQDVIISERNGEIFYTCPHPQNINPDAPIIFHLPSPTYKMQECTSTFGCSHRYLYREIVPPNLLSSEQQKQVIEKVMDLPEVKKNSGWTVDSFIIQPSADRWIGHVQLFIDGIQRLPPSQECGWYGQVDIDLESLNVITIENIPPRSTIAC